MELILMSALALWAVFAPSLQSDYFVTVDRRRMIEADLQEPGKRDSDLKDCVAIGDSDVIRSVLRDATPNDTIHDLLNTRDLDDLINRCEEHHRTSRSRIWEDIKTAWKGIYPGTKWCGIGDDAKHDGELGRHAQTDWCCREHDHCRWCIEGKKTKFGLTNSSPYTRCACSCDSEFRTCLKSTSEPTSTIIGNAFFNILRTECFQKVRTRVCVKRNRRKQCIYWTNILVNKFFKPIKF